MFLKNTYSQVLLWISLVLIGAGCSSSQETYNLSHFHENGSYEVLEQAKGIASYYSNRLHGRTTANGEIYDKTLLTAAHRKYPFGTIVRVTVAETGKSVIVRINDRGPFVRKRIIDLSYAAAEELSMIRSGIKPVRVDVLSWGD
jgi:peptidoglycan lytic transglycosylase